MEGVDLVRLLFGVLLTIGITIYALVFPHPVTIYLAGLALGVDVTHAAVLILWRREQSRARSRHEETMLRALDKSIK